MMLKRFTMTACSLFFLYACSNNAVNTTFNTTDTTAAQIDVSNTTQPAADTTPLAIEDFIRRDFKTWIIPPAITWEKVWYDRYTKGENKVYAVQADFDGNAKTDYAYILKDTANNFAVWAFLSKENSFTPVKIYDIQKLPGRRLHVGLSILPPGNYHDLNSADAVPLTVQTKFPALHVIFFGTAAKAYYYKDSSFHLIQTGD